MAKHIIEVSGRGVVVRGNDIDTDRIIPARYMKEITFDHMGEYAFYDERFTQELGRDGKPQQKAHPFNDVRFRGASILLVNKNFGCGSSREHAPQALMRWGITAIVGESFAAIFAGNCTMLGIPTLTVSSQEIEELMQQVEAHPQEQLVLDIAAVRIAAGNLRGEASMPESIRKALTEGTWDSTSLLLDGKDAIAALAKRLPYLNTFRGGSQGTGDVGRA
ncbi:3-isopropylmalate dehydratase small subunit [Candidatus Woesearchaeota archaeon CG_4_10_14_0_2_um_filter_57_5]|nr:MAG: 3-isopropylmalate dehydratase small subunit [Candidatus Woesearchaeota archaeon CG1_02_57_44]PIZ52664.1 MAG: 3-isopropylmalate dehydratase small subunit [Candidatus Woesearchaeota archaeon CG_4_10_14_0_2_um_filter_57_5]